MAHANLSTKLRETIGVVDEIGKLEIRADKVLNREATAERNILQCPGKSLTAVQDMKQCIKDSLSDSIKVHAGLRMVGIENSKLLSTAKVLLSFAEKETEKMEKFLKERHGFVPMAEKETQMNTSKPEPATNKSDKNLGRLAPETTTEHASEVSVSDKDSSPQKKEKGDGLLDMPCSPDIRDFIPTYKDKDLKRISIPSPETPPLAACADPKRYLDGRGLLRPGFGTKEDPNEGSKELVNGDYFDKPKPMMGLFSELPTSPSLPTLETNYFKCKKNAQRHTPAAAHDSSAKKFFETPRVKENIKVKQNKEAGHEKVPDVTFDSPGAGFTLHSRRSVLANIPDAKESIDDDTVYLLGGRRTIGSNLVTPETPELTQVRTLPSMQARELTDYFSKPQWEDDCPPTPPSPELTCQLKTDTVVNGKENIIPYDNGSSTEIFEVNEQQYELLPGYLKRLMPLDTTNDCLQKVLQTTFSLPGEKYPCVTTEKKIQEATGLASKSRSFIFLLVTLKIISKIVGTEYFEVKV